MSDVFTPPFDLEEMLAPPPPSKRAKRWAHASLPGVNPAILADHELMMRWRQDLHANPELGFEEHRTSSAVASLLENRGVEVHRGVCGGPTSVVGTLRGKYASEQSIGLRADMDALPMQDETSNAHRSTRENKHHGCGHDGHTAMLLGAAKHLAATREFSGVVHFFFQPNEEAVVNTTLHAEGASGGELMVRQGLFDRFPCDQVYGMHNWPALAAGTVGVKAGPLMGSEDNFIITVRGKGGHGAMPHLCVDPLLAGCHIVTALQSIVSRTADPVDALVVSVTQFEAGSAFNVTPSEAVLKGTLRAFDTPTREMAQKRLAEIAQSTAGALGATAEVEIQRAFPPTINDPAKAKVAEVIAARIVGPDNVLTPKATVASEDFAYMLQARPGCYLWLGQSCDRCPAMLHQGAYDFNDDVLPIGASIFVALVEQLQPATGSA
jgi:amidohydrolase